MRLMLVVSTQILMVSTHTTLIDPTVVVGWVHSLLLGQRRARLDDSAQFDVMLEGEKGGEKIT